MAIRDNNSTNEEQSTNDSGFARGKFTNLCLGDDAPVHLADFLATLGTMNFDYKRAAIDNPNTRYIVDYEPTDECPAHLEDAVGDEYYELEAQELSDGSLAVRFGTFPNKDGDLWIIGYEELFDKKVQRAVMMDNTHQDVTTFRSRGHGDLTLHEYNWFAGIIIEAAQKGGLELLVKDVSDHDPHKTVDIRDYQYAFYETEQGLYMPLGRLEEYGTAGFVFDSESLDDEFSETIERAASIASFYEQGIRLEVADTNPDRPCAEKQAAGAVETLERGNELERPWVETDHPRVYFANKNDQNPELKPTTRVTGIGKEIAEAFPDWDIVLTTGFHEHAISYNIRHDLGAIHLEVDSAMPARQHIGDITRDIHEGIQQFDS